MLIEIPLTEIVNHLNDFRFFLQSKILNKIKKESLISNVNTIRWGGIHHDKIKKTITLEVVYSLTDSIINSDDSLIYPLTSLRGGIKSNTNVGAMIIPTGLGCSIGGFGGDANTIANLLSKQFDYLIVNPNVVNGGAWQNISEKMLYVEGFALDLFMRGEIVLRANSNNIKFNHKLGLIIDRKMSNIQIKRELEVIKSAETIFGIDFIGYKVTREPLNQRITILEGNYSSGKIDNAEVLLEAGYKLKENGATAIAILTLCPEIEEQLDTNYVSNHAPDPIGGLEAICSHIITRELLMPCAHAPVFENHEKNELENYPSIDSRVSPEITSFSFLPSVLKGLQNAPLLIPIKDTQMGDITIHNLSAFIGPADCWLGDSFLSAISNNNSYFSSYAIESNKTGISIEPHLLNCHNVQMVKNYLELIGYLEAKKNGLKIKHF